MKPSFIFSVLILFVFQAFTQAGESEAISVESKITGGKYTLELLRPFEENGEHTIHLYIDCDSSTDALKNTLSTIGDEPLAPNTTFAFLTLPNDPLQINRDLTGDALKRIPESGNAVNFYLFIESKLIPMIEEKIRTEADRLILHTYGKSAAFGFYTMCIQPGLFDEYVFDSPEMLWHNAYPFRAEYSYYKTMNVSFPVSAHLYAAIEDDEKSIPLPMHQLQELLSYRQYQDLQIAFHGETGDIAKSRQENIDHILDTLYR